MDALNLNSVIIFENINEDKENVVDGRGTSEICSNFINQITKKKEKSRKIPNGIQHRDPKTEKNFLINVKLKPKNSNDNLAQKACMLTKKREITPKDKENDTNNINKEYINKFRYELKDIVFLYRTKTECYKCNKTISKKQIHIKIEYDRNLDWIDKKLIDTVTYKDEYIKKLIDKIIDTNDYPPFTDFLNEYIKDLLFCFSCIELIDNSKIYKSELKKRYLALIETFKKNGKSPEYIGCFQKCIEEIKKAYENMIE